jgi:hypothetical protein
LAQGLIGEENSYLLGAFLVSKLHQVVMARQEVAAAARRDFFLYIDEFQNFLTPSLAAILSGGRKYRLGLTLAHQDLRQLWGRDAEVASAVIANPSIRVCFRLGDFDAQRLKESFASFEPRDLQTLGVGEAVARIDRSDWDFNLKTLPVPPVDGTLAEKTRERLIALSREKYAKPRAEVEAMWAQVPVAAVAATVPGPSPLVRTIPSPPQVSQSARQTEVPPAAAPKPLLSGRGGAQHKYLQQLVKRFAEEKGFRVTIEKPVLNGLGSIDVAVERDDLSIACEISVASTAEHELKNVQKCLAAGFRYVAVISAEKKTIGKLREFIPSHLDREHAERVQILLPEEFLSFLEKIEPPISGKENTVRGYKVKVKYRPGEEGENKARSQAIAETIGQALRRLKVKGPS